MKQALLFVITLIFSLQLHLHLWTSLWPYFKTCARWVPHELTPEHKNICQMATALDFLTWYETGVEDMFERKVMQRKTDSSFHTALRRKWVPFSTNCTLGYHEKNYWFSSIFWNFVIFVTYIILGDIASDQRVYKTRCDWYRSNYALNNACELKKRMLLIFENFFSKSIFSRLKMENWGIFEISWRSEEPLECNIQKLKI